MVAKKGDIRTERRWSEKRKRGLKMRQSNVVTITHYRNDDARRRREHINAGKMGRVYSRGGRLWVDFYYLGERVREPSGLEDNPPNRIRVRKQLDLIMAEIENGVFEFKKRFPSSKRKIKFTMLEGRILRKEPQEIFFEDYVNRWWEEMGPGMSTSQVRDYTSILENHHLPYFSKLSFFELCSPVQIKKFVAYLKSKTGRFGKPLSAKRIHNIIIPLRVIVRDAIEEYGWSELSDPFAGLKLPHVRKIRVHPFTFDEWATLMGFIPPWYRPYFELAVQTGLRTSEQVALKWSAIDSQFIYIELSRVRNVEKDDLKTPESIRRVKIRPSMREVLDIQKEQTAHFNSAYVFLNTEGRPCLQDSLRWHWVKAMEKSGLPFRRMYETRHTFASWALSKGETPEWVARTLGHVDTSMVYRTYSRYIPNLTRQDGSALEELFTETLHKKSGPK
jgi:integrase